MSNFSLLKTDSPSSTGLLILLNVRSVQIAVLVMSFLRHPAVPCCSILPEYEKESENPLPRPFLTFHISAKLSNLVAVRHCVCYFWLTSSCTYTSVIFLNWREKVRLVTSMLITGSAASWHIEPTSPDLPPCHLFMFYTVSLPNTTAVHNSHSLQS